MKKILLAGMTIACLAIIIALALISLASIVSAFDVQSNLLTNVVCPSSTLVIEEKITADKDTKLEVLLEGTAASFATALPQALMLTKDEVASTYIYITPSSTVIPGSYSLNVVLSDGIETKRVSHNIIVENCNKLVLSLEPVKDVCACDAKIYKASIKNNGIYRERYKIEIMGNAASFARLSTDMLALDPGETRNFLVYFNPSCSLKADSYSFTLKASSLDSRALAILDGKINVRNCYGYELLPEKNFYSLCDGEKGSVKFTIANKGESENSYEINLDGPSWAHLTKNRLILAPGESNEVNISLLPKFGEKEGNYSLKIKTLSDKGKILAKDTITVQLRECHSASLEILFDKNSDKICNALSNTYEVELKNTGEKPGDYVLMLTGPSWAKLKNATTAQLEPQKSFKFNLEISPPYGTKSDRYEIKISAKDRNSEVKVSDEIVIETFTKEECYKPKINLEEKEIKVAKDSTKVIIATVENVGARKASYIVDSSGTANRFVSVTPSLLEIEPEKAKPLYIYIAPTLTTPNGTYDLTISIRLNDSTILASQNLKIEVVDKLEKAKEEELELELELENLTLEELERLEKELGEESKKESKKSLWSRIRDWFKKIFGKRAEKESTTQQASLPKQTNTSNISSKSSKLPTQSQLATQASQEHQQQQQQNKTINKTSFNEFLAKYKWEFIAALVIILIILILVLLDFFRKS
ncbi:MAG: FixG Ig-like domain-containing protein [Candidatus Pacearchaeota archaeon]